MKKNRTESTSPLSVASRTEGMLENHHQIPRLRQVGEDGTLKDSSKLPESQDGLLRLAYKGPEWKLRYRAWEL